MRGRTLGKRTLAMLLSACMAFSTFAMTSVQAAEEEPSTNTREVTLSDFDWVSATHGDANKSYVVQKDQTFSYGNGMSTNQADKNLKLMVDGTETTFETGISTTAPSRIEWDISSQNYIRLTGYIGVDRVQLGSWNNAPDGAKEGLVKKVTLYADDTKIWESTENFNPTDDAQKVDVAIPEGAKKLILDADPGVANQDGQPSDPSWGDEVDFADAKLIEQLPDPENLALNKTVTALNTDGSAVRVNDNPNNGRPLPMAVDGVIPTDDASPNYADFGDENGATAKSCYLQVDLGGIYLLDHLNLWRYFNDGRTYKNTVIQLSKTADFADPVTVYNADATNVHGLGAGTDAEYAETNAGHQFAVPKGTEARYVRLYSYGSSTGKTNHIVELQVWGWNTGLSPEEYITLVEDDSPSVSYKGNVWSSVADENASGGGSHQNVIDGQVYDLAVVEFTFTGTGVKLFGKAGADFGDAKISVLNRAGGDDYLATVPTVSSQAETDEYGRQVISFVGLEKGSHILRIVAKDKFDIDYFEVSTDPQLTDAQVTEIESAPVTMKVYDAMTLAYTMQDADGNYVCKKPELASDNEELLEVTDDRQNSKLLNDPGLIAMGAGETAFTISKDTASITVPVTIQPIEKAEGYRRVVDHEHPLYIENYYWGDDLSGSDVTMLWETIPDDMKPYTVILLIAERSIKDRDAWLEMGQNRFATANGMNLNSREWIEHYVKICNENQIPCAVQAINGENGMATIPMEFYDQLAKKYEYLQGYNAAEMYNGGNSMNEFSGYNDYQNYMTQLTRVCVENGMYLMWTDTELNTVHRWLENYAPMSNIFRENKHNIIMQNKQSFSDPSSEALYKGMWLSDYCDNWGVASDWWNWQISGLNSGMNGYGLGALAQCYDMPEVRYVQDIMRVLSQGATCFKSEAQWYSNATVDMRMPAYQRAILPFLERVVSGEIKIPTKEEVMERTKAIAVGEENWQNTYNGSISNVNPSESKYGIIPYVPANVPQQEIDKFKEAGMTVYDSSNRMTTAKLNEAYADINYELDKSGNAMENGYLETYGDGVWYWMNTLDRSMTAIQSSKFAPVIDTDIQSLKVSAQPHTLAVFNEDTDRISVHLQNYRSVKSDLKAIDPPDETPCNNAYYYSHRIARMLRDGTLEDKTRLTTTFEVKADSKPRLVFAPVDDYTNPVDANLAAETQVEWDEATKTATIRIQHNGPVSFDIVTDPSSKEAPESVTLSQSTMTLERHEAKALKATVSANTENRNVIWKSSDPSVASVSTVGMVAAVGAGTAEITATTAEGDIVSAPCVVTVNNPQIRAEEAENGAIALSMEGSTATVTLTPDEGYQLGAVVLNDQDVTAQVSNNTLTVTLSKDAVVKAFFIKNSITVNAKTSLQVGVDNANKINLNLYIKESADQLRAAINSANTVLKSASATSEQIVGASNAIYAAQKQLVERVYFTEEDPLVLPSQKNEKVTLEAELGRMTDTRDRNYVRLYYKDSSDPIGNKVITASNGLYVGSFATGNQLTFSFYASAAGVYTFIPYYKGMGSYSWSGTNVEPGTAEVDPTDDSKWSAGAFQVTVTQAGAGEITFTAPSGGTPNTDKFEIVAGVVESPSSYKKIPQSQMAATADSEHAASGVEGPASNVLDGDNSTIWHTKWGVTPAVTCPHTLTIDLGGAYTIGKFTYLPRQNGNNGNANAYDIQVQNGEDGEWATVASGSFDSSSNVKLVEFDPVSATAIRMVVKSSYGTPANNFASAAEINVYEFVSVPPAPTVNKEYLKDTIDAAEKAKQSYPANLIEAVKIRFEAALANAWAVYNDETATQEAVDEADEALITMLQYLSFTADIDGLKAAIAHAQEVIDSGLYQNDAAMDAYKAAKQAAEDLLAEGNITDTEIVPAIQALEAAERNLNEIVIEGLKLDTLKKQIDAAKLVREKLDQYIDGAEKDAFVAALNAAEDILAKALANDPSIDQAAVDKAASDLHSARFALRLIPNKDALKDLIDEAAKLDLSLYTEKSAQVLQEALAAARTVYDDPTADEAAVKQAEDTLKSAIGNLEKKSDNPSSDNNSSGGSSSGDKPSGTGDSTPIVLVGLLLAGAMSTIVLLRRRKES